jgi:ectoine hydroxylase-related dioxygenase (phytanoyl-CoA dioxygenase family)
MQSIKTQTDFILTGIKFQDGAVGGTYFNDYCNWKKIPEFQEYVHNSPAAELAGTLMCSEVSLLPDDIPRVFCEV